MSAGINWFTNYSLVDMLSPLDMLMKATCLVYLFCELTECNINVHLVIFDVQCTSEFVAKELTNI